MPIFDFACQECGKEFDLMIANKDKNLVRCPDCGSSQVKQLFSLFSTGGSKSSPPACGTGCSAASGGG